MLTGGWRNNQQSPAAVSRLSGESVLPGAPPLEPDWWRLFRLSPPFLRHFACSPLPANPTSLIFHHSLGEKAAALHCGQKIGIPATPPICSMCRTFHLARTTIHWVFLQICKDMQVKTSSKKFHWSFADSTKIRILLYFPLCVRVSVCVSQTWHLREGLKKTYSEKVWYFAKPLMF